MISKAINLRIKDRKIFERPILEYAFREILKKKLALPVCMLQQVKSKNLIKIVGIIF